MILAVFSSVAAMGQEKKSDEPDWMKDLASRITLNGYAQTDGRSCLCMTSQV